MGFIPILIVCSLATGYVGDKDSGSTCRRFFDRPEILYPTLQACNERLEELSQAVKVNEQWLVSELPRPWEFKGHCVTPMTNEKVA